MNIVIISQYLRDIENFDGNNNRFVYIAKLLAQNKSHSVEIITSNFNHSSKKHFDNVGFLENVKIKALHESGYAKNISLKRFYSHKMLAENIGQNIFRFFRVLPSGLNTIRVRFAPTVKNRESRQTI